MKPKPTHLQARQVGHATCLLLVSSLGSFFSTAMARPAGADISQAGMGGMVTPLLSQALQPRSPAQQKSPGVKTNFRFVAFGDYQGDNDQGDNRIILENLKEKAGLPAPSFYINTGDIGTLQAFDCKFPYAPLYPAKGNNDQSIWPSIYPKCGTAKNYYSIDLNNSHFAFLDSDPSRTAELFPTKSANLDCKKLKPNFTQTDWLACDLQTASNNSTIDNIFVVLHVPPLSHGGYGTNAIELNALEPIFKATPKLRAVLSGHNHFYQRLRRNDINYLVIGGAGAPLVPVPTTPPAEVKEQAESYHFVVFNVDGSKVSLDTIGYNKTTKVFASIEQVELSCKNGDQRKRSCKLVGGMGIRKDTCTNGSWTLGACKALLCPSGKRCCEVDLDLEKCAKCVDKKEICN